MASAAGSLFARIYAGHTGVDPYTTAVSDIYQDLFGEGIFTGKGLYDVDAFTAALEDRVPENALLSHDLFEGLYARTALVTDVEVVDDYPSSVLAHARRQHRWVRGDWQILLVAVPVRADARRARRATGCRSSRAGRSSTTCGAACWRRRRSLLLAARLDRPARAARWSGPRPASPRWRFRSSLARARRCSRGPRAAAAAGASSCATSVEDLKTAARAVRPAAHVPGEPGLRDGCTRSALTLVRLGVTQRRLLEWETTAASAARGGPRAAARVPRRHDARARCSRIAALAARRGSRVRRALPVAAADPRAVGRRAVGRVRAQPADARRARRR